MTDLQSGSESQISSEFILPFNWDILFCLLPFLTAPPCYCPSYIKHRCKNAPILPFMKTCHTLYKAGIPYFLHRTVHLSSKHEKLSSFCAFVLSDANRLLHIWDLRCDSIDWVDGEEVMARVTTELAEVLRGAQNLRRLRIDDSDVFLEADPALPEAIISLTNIEEIIVKVAGEVVAEMIPTMSSPLRSVQLSFNNTPFSPHGGEEVADIVPLLSRFRDHLTNLRFFHADLTPDNDIRYLHLRSLHLRSYRDWDIEDLVRTFPNLELLTWYTKEFSHEEAEELRASNLQSPLRG